MRRKRWGQGGSLKTTAWINKGSGRDCRKSPIGRESYTVEKSPLRERARKKSRNVRWGGRGPRGFVQSGKRGGKRLKKKRIWKEDERSAGQAFLRGGNFHAKSLVMGKKCRKLEETGGVGNCEGIGRK